MTPKVCFIVPGVPQPKERPRVGANGNVYTPRKTTEFEDTVRLLAIIALKQLGWPLDSEERFGVQMKFYFPDRRRRDLDNGVKAVLDGLQHHKSVPGVFRDDSQVDAFSCIRGYDKANPRVEIEIWKLEDGGG